MLVAKEQRPAIVPQDARRSAQTALLDFPSDIDPARFAAVADIELFVVPPELKTSERSELIAPEPENIAGIEQLLDLGFVFDIYLSHCSVLPENFVSSRSQHHYLH